ncbi:uncharacterized protein IL334_000306 [Kwoniella shivajii]|uniref:F-box domain-containing protein n=1 Tax=Kwoniella shivajii TaxID=564305 RepID=A0ABZ1CNT0_9TREE|nr:hypothetical protein IL334_000306 [Kwoniella shivajii]
MTQRSNEIYSPIPRHLSLIPALNGLSISDRNHQHERERGRTSTSSPPQGYPQPSSSRNSYNDSPRNVPGRVYTATPSSTSISSDDEEDDQSKSLIKIEEPKSWLDMTGGVSNEDENADSRSIDKSKGKGKGKDMDMDGLAARLPPEILIQILRLLPDNDDLLSSLLVSRSWCLCAFSLLWSRPNITTSNTLASLIRVISSPIQTLPYSDSIRRIHLSQLSNTLTDELLLGISSCKRLERLTITGSNQLSPDAIMAVIKEMPELVSVDFSGVLAVNDDVVYELSKHCIKLQAVNLVECKLLGDQGVLGLAKYCKSLRRAKFIGCHRITANSLIPLVQNCDLLLELDLQDVISTSDSVVYSIFLNSTHLRELKLNNCLELTEDSIPNLEEMRYASDDEIIKLAQSINLPIPTSSSSSSTASTIDSTSKYNHNRDQGRSHLDILRPSSKMLDHLRVIDFTGCTNLGDKAIENLIPNAPKLRTLTLTKCSNLTDKSLESIEKLGKHLHYLHLGHVKLITDAGVIRLSKSCTRLRYIDLACCDLLTDESITELGVNMPKLRRVGLVKVIKITDESLYALVERYTSLERIHLSYCDNLSVKAISHMLNKLPHLKHLSLTGVSSFKKDELQHFCRAPPDSFNEHQRSAFCVFSGHKVDELRRYLNEVYLVSILAAEGESDSTSFRRDSGSSSTSSITVPGTTSPPLFHSPFGGGLIYPNSHYNMSPNINRRNGSGDSTGNGYVYRRGSAPTLRDNGSIAVPGLPSMVFANPTPNFLTPQTTITTESRRTTRRDTQTNLMGNGINMSPDLRNDSSSSTDERRNRRRGGGGGERPFGPREAIPQRLNMPGGYWDANQSPIAQRVDTGVRYSTGIRQSSSITDSNPMPSPDRFHNSPNSPSHTVPQSQHQHQTHTQTQTQTQAQPQSPQAGLGIRWFRWGEQHN